MPSSQIKQEIYISSSHFCPPHQHPSFTRCHIRRSAHPPFTIVLEVPWTTHQARWEGGVGGKLPRAPRRLGAPPSARNIKNARMYHFEKKNSSQRGPQKMSWGPARMFPRAGPAVAFYGPATQCRETSSVPDSDGGRMLVARRRRALPVFPN